eukprot:341330-Amphidinium_carterae.1
MFSQNPHSQKTSRRDDPAKLKEPSQCLAGLSVHLLRCCSHLCAVQGLGALQVLGIKCIWTARLW